jgi:hypothetical protein
MQGGVIIPAGNSDAHDEHQAEFSSASIAAAAAETAAGIDITASIAAASSSASAATASVNPLDPLSAQNTNLTPEQLGQLSGLHAKLQIDDQFGDTGAATRSTTRRRLTRSLRMGKGASASEECISLGRGCIMIG